MIDMSKLQPIYNKIETQNLSSPASRNPWFLWVYIALIVIGLAYLTIKAIKDHRYYYSLISWSNPVLGVSSS